MPNLAGGVNCITPLILSTLCVRAEAARSCTPPTSLRLHASPRQRMVLPMQLPRCECMPCRLSCLLSVACLEFPLLSACCSICWSGPQAAAFSIMHLRIAGLLTFVLSTIRGSVKHMNCLFKTRLKLAKKLKGMSVRLASRKLARQQEARRCLAPLI